MHIDIKINMLGQSNTYYDVKSQDILERVELWRRENPYATATEVSNSDVLSELNEALFKRKISEETYNSLWYYLYHGHLQYKTISQRRSGMAVLNPDKRAYCYAYIDKIQDDRVLLKDVHIDGVTTDDEDISFHITHVWLFARGMQKAISENRIHEGDHIRFRGKPYLYKRHDGTKDYAFSNCNNKQIHVIRDWEYRQYLRLEAI